MPLPALLGASTRVALKGDNVHRRSGAAAVNSVGSLRKTLQQLAPTTTAAAAVAVSFAAAAETAGAVDDLPLCGLAGHG
jgi:hypothetical protein